MRIAIDARLNAYRRGGIPQYTRNLMAALAEIDRENQYISLQHRHMLRPLAVASNVRRHVVYTPPHNRFEQWTLPLELLAVRPDVLHCPDFVAPMRRSFPAIVTIHDLAFMQYPEILDSDARQYYGRIARSSARAEGVIAVSESTRQDIAQYLDIPIEQIDVVYEAAAPVFRPMDLRAGEARVLNGEPVAAKTFMLFVSTLEPRKNLPTLLKALRIAIDRRPDRAYQLVVVGGRGWKDQPIFDAVRDLNLGDHVLFAGNVGVYDLRWLYNACRFYVNPSLYEGFGLPLLEAMASGAACLASATSSLPEIGGDAAIYVPPLEPGLWADAIEQLWDDQERLEELGRLGSARAQRFSWQRAARETLKIYERVAKGLPRESVRAVEEPARQLAPVVGERLGATEAARACLRCGSHLVPGELQHDLTIRRTDEEAKYNVLASRAWVCPNCGQVELVSEWRALVPEQTVESAPTPQLIAITTAEPLVANDGRSSVESPDDQVVVASAEELPENTAGASMIEDDAPAVETVVSTVEHANDGRTEPELAPIVLDEPLVLHDVPAHHETQDHETAEAVLIAVDEPVQGEIREDKPAAEVVAVDQEPLMHHAVNEEQSVAEDVVAVMNGSQTDHEANQEQAVGEVEAVVLEPVYAAHGESVQDHAFEINAVQTHHAIEHTEHANGGNGAGDGSDSHAPSVATKQSATGTRRGSRRKRR